MVCLNVINNLLLKKKKVRLARGSILDKRTVFDGSNYIGHYSRVGGSNIGYGTYIGTKSNIQNCTIGKYCSIGSNVEVINGFHPTRHWVTTHPAFYAISNCTGLSYTSENKYNEFRYAEDGKTCIIGNDVWIGNNAIIMAGVIIGDGAIVGAGAVVTKNVEPYSIVVGVPATILKYRFSQEEIQQLIAIKWWDKDDNWIARNAKYFENVVDFIEKSD